MPSPESQQLRAIFFAMKNQPPPPLDVQRRNLDEMAERISGGAVQLPTGMQVETVSSAGIVADWLIPTEAAPDRAMLYLHGGAYTLGSRRSHRSIVANLAQASGMRALLPEYRLAPEHPYPAAVEDATAVYRWMLAQGLPPSGIVVAGDSAGGGLTLALLLTLRDAGYPMPAAAVLLSPWTDLAGTGKSVVDRADLDPWLSGAGLAAAGQVYAGSHDVREPHISPVYADLHGLPPLLIHVGSDEVLYDDAARVAEKVRATGGAVDFVEWDGMWHVFQSLGDFLPEAREAIAQIGIFARVQTGLPPSA